MSTDNYIGFKNMSELMAINDFLSAKTVDQVNDSQGLVMMNSFSQEANEHVLNSSLKDRVSELQSWSWVLQDLSKRLEDALHVLKYERHSVEVVIGRICNEISAQGLAVTKPGALSPMSDPVEEAVIEEYKFLTKQKERFEFILKSLHKQIRSLQEVRHRIEEDIAKKKRAIAFEEKCMNDPIISCTTSTQHGKRKKKQTCARWESRCKSIKKAGLQALNDALVARQQVRGARVQLSIMSQTHLSRVDTALKRRLHANQTKLNELQWQRQEAVQDYNSLADELSIAEKSLLETIYHNRKIENKMAARNQRPFGERTRDDLDLKLRGELARSRSFAKGFTDNIKRIEKLQNNLVAAITDIDNAAEDLNRVIALDSERLNNRQGDCVCKTESIDAFAPDPFTEGPKSSGDGNEEDVSIPSVSHPTQAAQSISSFKSKSISSNDHRTGSMLTVIVEENENDEDFRSQSNE